MNVYRRVEKALKKSPLVKILSSHEGLEYLEEVLGSTYHGITYHTYLHKPLYEPRELNALMHDLVPGVSPESICKSWTNTSAKVVIPGWVQYEEVIGEIEDRRVVTLTDVDGFAEEIKARGKVWRKKTTLTRTIMVYVSPDERIAKMRAASAGLLIPVKEFRPMNAAA